MPMSHSAVRKMSARARHEDADQCRVSNWRAFSNRLSERPGSDREAHDFGHADDRACRSAPAGRYVRPVERLAAAFAFRPDGLRNSGRKMVRDIASFLRATELADPSGETVWANGLGRRSRRKARQRGRKAASIFASSVHKLSVSRPARTGAGARLHRYCASRYPTPSSVSRMRGRVGSTSIFLRRLRTTMRR